MLGAKTPAAAGVFFEILYQHSGIFFCLLSVIVTS